MPDLGYALLGELGAPKGRIETFTEIRLKGTDGRDLGPMVRSSSRAGRGRGFA